MTHPPTGGSLTEFVYRPQRAADAREAVCDFVARLHPAPAAGTVQSLLLLVSELVVNSLRHAGTVTALCLAADGGTVRVRVSDPSPARPRTRTPDMTGHGGGFGWQIVQRLAQEVSVRDAADGGKAVIATLPR